MNCSNCGALVKDDDIKCSYCGKYPWGIAKTIHFIHLYMNYHMKCSFCGYEFRGIKHGEPITEESLQNHLQYHALKGDLR